jgi:hypothetical protein
MSSTTIVKRGDGESLDSFEYRVKNILGRDCQAWSGSVIEAMVTDGGMIYWRESIDEHFTSSSRVICECGGFEFSISYGSYECIGTCSECGKSASVYSG